MPRNVWTDWKGMLNVRRRRQLESDDERETRPHLSARIPQRRRATESVEQRVARSQTEAVRLLRRRQSESSEIRAVRLQTDAQRHQQRRSLEDEHERFARLRSNALANYLRRYRPSDSIGVAMRVRVDRTNYLGGLDQRCTNCGALHFCYEVKANHPDHFRERYLKQLFVSELGASEEQRRYQRDFMGNKRSFNSALAMASMGAHVDTPHGRGPYCFRFHGQVHHRLGPLHPKEGKSRLYGQIYILDTELAVHQRMGNARNAECNPQLM
ncbi:hypothetical protein GCK32_015283 [Trichostrongylus colubriformis]|uniref:Helitron helicase-like domain-containing protein n=1 Tax=Trichostrongylus colubriformis TaxID=6319 RepID=A0AAN8FMA4_TRICO